MLDKRARFLQCSAHMKTTLLPLKNSMNRSPLRFSFLLNALAVGVAWLVPSQLANAQCPQICDGGLQNTALGDSALINNIGVSNTAVGWQALYMNTSGGGNTASGVDALVSNTTGNVNTAIGENAMSANTTGNVNTAMGFQALGFNTSGNENTAIGESALLTNGNGQENTGIGGFALESNRTGNHNVALGYFAGRNSTTGSGNVYIGARMVGFAGESNACYIASIFGQTSASGIPVLINSSNKLGTTTSSKRFKENIKAMDKASEVLFSLKPVSFRYKKDLDPAGIPQFGLVAEDVEKVNPALVVRDQQGKPYTVRYEAVNAMLLNEFLKEHQTVQELKSIAVKQEATIAELKSTIAQQQKGIEVLTSALRKVSDQLELSKSVSQAIAKNH